MMVTRAKGGETSQLGCAVKLDSSEIMCFLGKMPYFTWILGSVLCISGEK